MARWRFGGGRLRRAETQDQIAGITTGSMMRLLKGGWGLKKADRRVKGLGDCDGFYDETS